MMKIYGAGIAGLLAACAFQRATVYEAKTEEEIGHKALLRFRTSAVGDAVGIPFRKVRVRKAIWSEDRFYDRTTICHANHYAQKVVNRTVDRSIWDLSPVDRYIAPEDFIPQLIERVGDRIRWGHKLTASEVDGYNLTAISTLPIPVMLSFFGADQGTPDFAYAPIRVTRYRVPNADVHQTIYFPDPETPVYRASITGDLMIVESMAAEEQPGYYLEPFGLRRDQVHYIETVDQGFGKIVPVDERWRQSFIYNLSRERNIFSLGRFATWRNILLDDVLHDIDVIKRLMAANQYEHFMAAGGR